MHEDIPMYYVFIDIYSQLRICASKISQFWPDPGHELFPPANHGKVAMKVVLDNLKADFFIIIPFLIGPQPTSALNCHQAV